MTDKKLIFKIYKQLIQPNSKKQTNKQKKLITKVGRKYQ